MLLNPPAPWQVFGSNVGREVELEFWGADEAGMPYWERVIGHNERPTSPGARGAELLSMLDDHDAGNGARNVS